MKTLAEKITLDFETEMTCPATPGVKAQHAKFLVLRVDGLKIDTTESTYNWLESEKWAVETLRAAQRSKQREATEAQREADALTAAYDRLIAAIPPTPEEQP